MERILLMLVIGISAGAGCYRSSNAGADFQAAETGDDRPEGSEVVSDSASDAGSDEDTDAEPNTPEECRGAIDFPDARLMAVVRDEIAKPTGDLFYDDIRQIVDLSAHHMEITDLSGIECLSGLDSLDLGNNYDLGDISPLADLPGLTTLYLWGNRLSDLTPLVGLTHLSYVVLSDNKVSDLSPLVSNPGIDNGDEVFLRGNALICDDTVTLGHLRALEERGVILHDDCL